MTDINRLRPINMLLLHLHLGSFTSFIVSSVTDPISNNWLWTSRACVLMMVTLIKQLTCRTVISTDVSTAKGYYLATLQVSHLFVFFLTQSTENVITYFENKDTRCPYLLDVPCPNPTSQISNVVSLKPPWPWSLLMRGFEFHQAVLTMWANGNGLHIYRGTRLSTQRPKLVVGSIHSDIRVLRKVVDVRLCWHGLTIRATYWEIAVKDLQIASYVCQQSMLILRFQLKINKLYHNEWLDGPVNLMKRNTAVHRNAHNLFAGQVIVT